MPKKPALLGGTKVRTTPTPEWPQFGEPEQRALLKTLPNAWGGIGGENLPEFERRVAGLHQCRFGVAVFNGTVSLELALRGLGIGPWDEVILPAYTFMACASAVVMAHATPVFADIEPETLNLDPAAVEAAVTERTRAIMVVHMGGCPVDIEAIAKVASKHGLWVIEDCAHAHLAEWRGRRVGSLGHVGSFSFQNSKNLTTGEGGMLVTNDENLANRLWSLHNCGRGRGGKWYEHRVLGGNYRMTEFQAAIGLCQLDRLPEQHTLRQQNAARLDGLLSQIPGIAPQKVDSRVTSHGRHLYIFRYHSDQFAGLHRNRFVEALCAEGIPAMTGYVPLYRERMFAGLATTHYRRSDGNLEFANVRLPATEKACDEEAVWLPHTYLLQDEAAMQDVAEAIAKIHQYAGELR